MIRYAQVLCIYFAIFSGLLFFGCQRGGIVVQQQKMGPGYLASTHVGSPDPRPPPNGSMIIVEWWLPRSVVELNVKLRISMIFLDFSEKVVEFPIRSTTGYEIYQLVGKEFKERKGFLAYRAEAVGAQGEVYAKWTHQFWVRLINPKQDEVGA